MELEVFLGVNDDMARFFQDGAYNLWQSEETLPGSNLQLHADDESDFITEGGDAAARDARRTRLLRKRRRELKTFLNQVAKFVSTNHYIFVMRQVSLYPSG